MREIAKLSLVLVVITVVSASLLGITNDVTKVIIDEKAMEANIAYMKEILPEADTFKAIENTNIKDIDAVEEAYEALKDNSTIGYVVKTVVSGYGGDIVQLTGINNDGLIAGIRIASQSETPGVGSKILEDNFINQFVGNSTTKQFKVDKVGNDEDIIEIITGATISTKAATDGVNVAIKLYEDLLK